MCWNQQKIVDFMLFQTAIFCSDPNNSEPNRLHVTSSGFAFIHSKYILYIDSSEMIGNPLEVSNKLWPVISWTQPVHLQQKAGSPQAILAS